MFGFHQRTRSLIPVRDLAKYDTKVVGEMDGGGEDNYDAENATPTASRRQLTVIYILFLAEAIMASSLQPQLKMLITNEGFCGNFSTSYIRSILDCAYACGGISGLLWGWLSDRIGRRPVALMGVFGMSCCCLGMGFATTLTTCAMFRFCAGLVSSSTAVITLTMIGDISRSTSEKAKNISRLPLIALCGSIGPFVEGMVSGSNKAFGEIWQRYPILSGQIACGSLVFMIGIVMVVMLEETLPGFRSTGKSTTKDSSAANCEKTAFLGQMLEDDQHIAATIHVIDFVRPDPIPIMEIIRAPSLLLLLSSFSVLSLHAATFDALLPHLGHSSTNHGGMGIDCSALGFVVLLVRCVAGLLILATVPRIVETFGLLKPYRFFSLTFPAIYVATPIFAYLAARSPVSTGISSIFAIMFKSTFTGSAQVLMALLVLNAAPDAFSSGTIVGLMQFASLFKALAVAINGASFYFSSNISVATTNFALWSSVAVISLVGATLAWFVRERPSVEQDFPAEVLNWEMCFDAGYDLISNF
ncbi:MAG: hypothetical protein M1827_007009 [Pycnora praestabilis]|nr:MAG: hypothetical protein M1827_007009 [Pycnora praestabilis]